MTPSTQASLVPQIVNLIGTGFDRKFAPYQRMANVIIHLTRKNGGCLPQDLLPLGFTKQETVDLWHMANAMAYVEIKIMNDKNCSQNMDCI